MILDGVTDSDGALQLHCTVTGFGVPPEKSRLALAGQTVAAGTEI